MKKYHFTIDRKIKVYLIEFIKLNMMLNRRREGFIMYTYDLSFNICCPLTIAKRH